MGDGPALIAWVDNGSTRGEFTQSIMETVAADAAGARRFCGYFRQVSGVNVASARNIVAGEFLNHPAKPEWLFMVDADQSWTPEMAYRLLDIADPVDRPIVGGVVVGMEDLSDGDHDTFLTLYTVDPQSGPLRHAHCPDATLVKVDATGAAFLVVHRTVFEKLRADNPTRWWWAFEELALTVAGREVPMGEDTSFCLRAGKAGFPIHVYTGVNPKHHKGPLVLDLAYHERKQAENRTTVVVPVKDNLAMTSRLLNQLRDQGGFDRVFVFDNGSKRETRNWLTSQTWFTTFDAEGASIHEMWNAGIDLSLAVHPRTNIAFLNNDLKVGDRFLPGLADALRSDPRLLAVSPNYDGRDGPPLIPVTGISAGKTDGTGGMAGFAFMARGEWFRTSGYRFPTDARWWFGDTDFALTVSASGGGIAVVRDTTVEHLDGGGQTTRPDWWDDQIQADEAWFWSKWQDALKPVDA